jgi:hypothetical protein
LKGQPSRERGEVRERPQIVSTGPTRADPIAEEVKVHGQKADGKHAKAADGEEGKDQRNGNRRKDTVQHSVVVPPVVPRAGSPQKTIDSIQQETQAVGVRKNTAPGGQRPVASAEAKRIGQRPRGQKMRNWTHRFFIRITSSLPAAKELSWVAARSNEW